jgi:hypothetical protein
MTIIDFPATSPGSKAELTAFLTRNGWVRIEDADSDTWVLDLGPIDPDDDGAFRQRRALLEALVGHFHNRGWKTETFDFDVDGGLHLLLIGRHGDRATLASYPDESRGRRGAVLLLDLSQ